MGKLECVEEVAEGNSVWPMVEDRVCIVLKAVEDEFVFEGEAVADVLVLKDKFVSKGEYRFGLR